MLKEVSDNVEEASVLENKIADKQPRINPLINDEFRHNFYFNVLK